MQLWALPYKCMHGHDKLILVQTSVAWPNTHTAGHMNCVCHCVIMFLCVAMARRYKQTRHAVHGDIVVCLESQTFRLLLCLKLHLAFILLFASPSQLFIIIFLLHIILLSTFSEFDHVTIPREAIGRLMATPTLDSWYWSLMRLCSSWKWYDILFQSLPS